MEYKELREKQLQLFEDADQRGGDVITCSLPNCKPWRAKFKVYFRNGYYRLVCGRCVKKFNPKENPNIERIEPFKPKKQKK